MNRPRLAYIAQGSLHLCTEGNDPELVESVFGRSLRDRASQIQQRHAWKAQDRGAQFMMGMLWAEPNRDASEFPVQITGVCRGPQPGELLYSLETSDVGGVFLIDASGIERRLFHTADYRLRHLDLSPDGSAIPASVTHNHFSSHLAVLSVEGAGAPTAGSTGTQTPFITFHGGPVMGTPTVYLIWYGNWNQSNGSDTASGQTIVRDFLHGLSGSHYYLINTSYGAPTGLVNVGGEYTDAYSLGTRLSDSKVQAVVSNAISGHLPKDANGLYFVLTSSDVSESSGFCTRYCGWHTAGTISGTNIKYSFVGNANRCLNACSAQTAGPNGNAGVDAMLSVIAHELEETNTDPNPISGWADSGGAENGDKCAWTFGKNLGIAPNGAYYNITLPGISVASRNYLIQRNLDANSLCYVDYVTKAQ